MNHPLVIVVAHGSRSKRWVAAVEDWFADFSEKLGVIAARLSFLEITEPLFADVLSEESGREIIIFPFFLSRSGHAGEDIPEIAERVLGVGQFQILQIEGWEALLGANAARRLKHYGARPGDPVVVSGYGASTHDELWIELVENVRLNAGPYGDAPWLWAPSGHYLPDAEKPLRDCLAGLRRAAILPLYLSVSSYQETLIPHVIDQFPGLEIFFQPDSILPDDAIAGWAAGFVTEQVHRFSNPTKGQR